MACAVRALLESVALSWLDRASRRGAPNNISARPSSLRALLLCSEGEVGEADFDDAARLKLKYLFTTKSRKIGDGRASD